MIATYLPRELPPAFLLERYPLVIAGEQLDWAVVWKSYISQPHSGDEGAQSVHTLSTSKTLFEVRLVYEVCTYHIMRKARYHVGAMPCSRGAANACSPLSDLEPVENWSCA